MVDSSTYTPETVARRLQIAQAMLGDNPKITHWAQGLNELAKGYVGGNIYKGAENAEREGQNASYAAIASLLGGGGGAPTGGDAAPAMPPAVSSGITTGPRPPTAAPLTEGPPPDAPPAGPQPMPRAMNVDPDPYKQDTFRMGLNDPNMRPPQAAIVAALRGGAGMPPVAGPAALPDAAIPPAAQPVSAMPAAGAPLTPPAPREAAPAGPAPTAGPAAGGPPDMKAKIAEMLQSPNPYVRRQGAALGQQVIAGMLKSDGTDNIKNFEYAKKNGFQGSFLDFVQQEKSKTGGKYGLQPIWGSDAQGNPVILQLSPSGEAAQTKLPQGITPSSKNLTKVDTGTEIHLIDPVTHQVVSSTPKDIVGKESAEEIGKAKGLATADLPRVMGNAQQALDTIDKIKAHPGKQFGIGATGFIPGIPGTQQKDFVSLVDQLKGKTFLEAFNSLRGGGAITEIEGKKATDALGRLDRTQTKEGFDAALKDLQDVIKLGVANAQKKASMGGSGATPGAAVAPTGVNSLKQKYGLE